MRVEPLPEAAIENRQITELLHFTTNRGLLGILATRTLKCRDLLEEDKYLEFIFHANAHIRRDTAWTGHVNFSISRVNPSFFSIAQRWHALENVWWYVLSFDPIVMTHRNVTFATTNNIWSGVLRGRGLAGFEALFAPVVQRYAGHGSARRRPDHPDNWATCEEAEVLYPASISTDYLRIIYCATPEQLHTAEAQLNTLGHPTIKLVLAPAMFGHDAS